MGALLRREGRNMTIPKVRPCLLILALVGNLALAAGPYAGGAHACSCAGGWSTEEEFRRSTAVFSGEVVEVGKLPMEQVGPTDPGVPLLAPVTFDVTGAWKGVTGDTVVVHGQGPGPSCGLNFERGETYLVFAGARGRSEEGPLETGLCSSTRQASEETARNLFDPTTGSLPETGGIPHESPKRGEGSRLAAAAGASLVVGALLIRRAVRGSRR